MYDPTGMIAAAIQHTKNMADFAREKAEWLEEQRLEEQYLEEEEYSDDPMGRDDDEVYDEKPRHHALDHPAYDELGVNLP